MLCCSSKLFVICAIFSENKMVLHPDSSVPDGHEGDAKEEAEDATHLGNHGEGGIKIKEKITIK